MSTERSITINFFDINGVYQENVPVKAEEMFLFLDCPMRIIDQYISENFLQDVKKEAEDQFIIKYKFSYEIQKNLMISIKCDIINNFSVSHSGTLDSNGYVVFCNLESQNTFELLQNILEYIKENCSINVKTYVIGVFKENIYDDKTYIKMQSFLSQLDFEYEYYEMFLGNKEMFKIINKEHENAETMDEIFKIIFKEIYEGGKGPRLKKESNIKDGMDGSMGKCIIF